VSVCNVLLSRLLTHAPSHQRRQDSYTSCMGPVIFISSLKQTDSMPRALFAVVLLHTTAALVSAQSSQDDKERAIAPALLIAIGGALVTFAGISIKRSKREADRIQELWDANTTLSSLEGSSSELPGLVIIKGVIAADDKAVTSVCPTLAGLSGLCGSIEQPHSALIDIAMAVKSISKDDNKKAATKGTFLEGATDEIERRTGVSIDDVPDVVDDYNTRASAFHGEGRCVMSEVLVTRLCGKAQTVHIVKEGKKRRVKEIEVRRPQRNQAYPVFHGRQMAAGLHMRDTNGGRLDLCPPAVDTVSLGGLGEPPSLFLSANDGMTEFFSYIRKEGISVGDTHIDMQDLPPSKLSDPYTMLSHFIFIDQSSALDLGSIGSNAQVLQQLCEAYNGGPQPCLFEPRGFYDDGVQGGGQFTLPSYASFKKTEMVSANELLRCATQASNENTQNTLFHIEGQCHKADDSRTKMKGPRKADLAALRDKENAFRYTELAVPFGAEVTVLGKPVRNKAGGITVVPPNETEDGRSSADPSADRFRFRILKGHGVENLVKQRELNMNMYYGLAVVGVAMIAWGTQGLISTTGEVTSFE